MASSPFNNIIGWPKIQLAATRLIHQVCCLAGSFELIEWFADQDLCTAIDRHDTAALYDRLIYSFSFQGISDEVAENYMHRHGRPTWRAIGKNLARRPTCPKLKTYWQFYDCRYEKTRHTRAEPDRIATCPLPTHRLRNGHLNQVAYSLYLFIRDVADGDLVGWIDDRLDQANDPMAPDWFGRAQNVVIDPMRNIYGVSDKVLTVALSGILIGAAAARPRWLEVGVQLIAVDTLVHNFLHRTGILTRLNAAHAYGPGCYRSGGCADIIQAVASQIDARQFNASFPKVFPRFVQQQLSSGYFRSTPESGNSLALQYLSQGAMCGRLRVGKENLHVAGLVGAAMCSTFQRGSRDRWS